LAQRLLQENTALDKGKNPSSESAGLPSNEYQGEFVKELTRIHPILREAKRPGGVNKSRGNRSTNITSCLGQLLKY